MQETLVQFLGREDPLENGQATHSVFWPGEFHELYSSWGRKESDMTERLSFSLHFHTCFINLNSLNSLNWNRMFEIDGFILDSYASIGSWVCSPSQSSCQSKKRWKEKEGLGMVSQGSISTGSSQAMIISLALNWSLFSNRSYFKCSPLKIILDSSA